MQISAESEAVLSYLDKVTDGALRKRDDLGALLEIGATTAAADEFNTLVFSGKACWNVYGVLRKTPPADEKFNVVEKEFGERLQALREALLFFAANAEVKLNERWQQVYLGMGQGTARNLVDLAQDLARLKDLQNEHRHGGSGS